MGRTIGAKIEELLPEWVAARTRTNPDWPTVADCARQLAWTDWSWQAVWSDLSARLNDPPFAGQLNHDAQMRRWTALSENLAPAKEPAGISEARRVCEGALATFSPPSKPLGQPAAGPRRAAGFEVCSRGVGLEAMSGC